ncbi:MAG: metal ABC transporter substrate-binding protein [Spirochaetales bacterium]|nr:metal ABC transporter substrate-binding protein [Spirochaetales bacterium]
MKKLFILLLLALTASVVFAGGSQEESDSITVVTSTSIVNDVVKEIAGDSVEIFSLIAKGTDPHSYEPTPRDMARVETADIVFTNGFDLEENLMSVLETVSTGMIVEVSRTIEADYDDHEGEEHHEDDHHDHEGEEHHDDDHHDHEGEEPHEDDHHDHEGEEPHEDDHHDDDHHGHNHDGADPHTWMSPLNVLQWVDVIEQALAAADPGNSSVYAANADAYRAELLNLDTWIREELDVLPPDHRVLVTDHNVFSHFAEEYDFEVIGTIIPGFSTSAEPSAGEISKLISLLEKEHVEAIFIGEASGEGIRKLAETLNRESDHEISVHEILTGSLREEGSEGDNYIDFMKYNVNQIISGLDK